MTIPHRAGVGASCVSLQPGKWPNLLSFLIANFDHINAEEWVKRLKNGDIFGEQGETLGLDQVYAPHTKVYYFRQVVSELPIPFDETVVFQDKHLLVADKPHFLPVLPSGRFLHETLLVRLKRKLNLTDLVPLHRIDQGTAGLVLFSVNPASRSAYARLFRERQVFKQYQAVTHLATQVDGDGQHDDHATGLLPTGIIRSRMAQGDSFMTMVEVPGEPNAVTGIESVTREGDKAVYCLRPVTGQRHQLRVQLAARACPIINDQIYPVLTPELPLGQAPDYSRPLQLLAQELGFDDPVTGQARHFVSQRRLLHADLASD
jgi:tRNA pseudouridine32 synthase / 23S rRNA pseudouridine746 synthase